jgi:hypothetical protein
MAVHLLLNSLTRHQDVLPIKEIPIARLFRLMPRNFAPRPQQVGKLSMDRIVICGEQVMAVSMPLDFILRQTNSAAL